MMAGGLAVFMALGLNPGSFECSALSLSHTPSLSLKPRLALNSCSSCFYLPSAEITGMCHQAWLEGVIFSGKQGHHRLGVRTGRQREE
jgi:hypothetical protein